MRLTLIKNPCVPVPDLPETSTMTNLPQGSIAGGRNDDMTPTRLREIISFLGWSQRELAGVLQFENDSGIRAQARGKERISPPLAAWLERLNAFQETAGFPIGILWWSKHYVSAFRQAFHVLADSNEAVSEWLRDIIVFYDNNKLPGGDWRVSEAPSARASLVEDSLSVLGLRMFGDVGRVLRAETRAAKSWDRRPSATPQPVALWLRQLAQYKSATGFPIEIFCLNPTVITQFDILHQSRSAPPEGVAWIIDAIEFYTANAAPEGYEPYNEDDFYRSSEGASREIDVADLDL